MSTEYGTDLRGGRPVFDPREFAHNEKTEIWQGTERGEGRAQICVSRKQMALIGMGRRGQGLWGRSVGGSISRLEPRRPTEANDS